MASKKENVTTVTEDLNTPITPNSVLTSEDLSNSNILDILALNNELTSLNKGELRFKVVKKDNYEFDAKDKDGNPQYTEYGEVKKIVSPYVEIVAEGINSRLSTKRLPKEELELLEVGKDYIGTYVLTDDLSPNFIQIVPFKLELESRLKHLNQGN